MGWNEGYEIMEATVIAVYDTGKLTKESLDTLMLPYYDTDIDSGGSQNLRSKDGHNVKEIVCLVMEPERYRDEVGDESNVMPNYVQRSEKGFSVPYCEGYYYDTWQEAVADEHACKVYDLWLKITKKHWKFW